MLLQSLHLHNHMTHIAYNEVSTTHAGLGFTVLISTGEPAAYFSYAMCFQAAGSPVLIRTVASQYSLSKPLTFVPIYASYNTKQWSCGIVMALVAMYAQCIGCITCFITF